LSVVASSEVWEPATRGVFALAEASYVLSIGALLWGVWPVLLTAPSGSLALQGLGLILQGVGRK
jgi:hypothetical protein